MDEFKPIVLTNNFAGFAYDESADKLLSRGAHSIRKEIMDTPKGTAMLQTKNGMPRVIGLRKEKCLDDLSPLTEISYDDREYYAEAEDEGDRLYSYDGLFSVDINRLSTLRVTSSAEGGRTARILRVAFAKTGELEGVDAAPGVLAETSRSYSETVRLASSYAAKLCMGFVSKALTAIHFARESCKGTAGILNLDAATYADNTTTAAGEIFGDHVIVEVDRPEGPVMRVVARRNDSPAKAFTLNLADPGGVLDHFSTKAMEGIGAFYPFPENERNWFPWVQQFAPPFKYYLTPLGLFTDETMTDELTPQDAGLTTDEDGDDYKFNALLSVDLTYAPRYFKFVPETYPVDIEGAKLRLLPDVQFNHGMVAASPGQVIHLDFDEHLYKDPDGRVWVIKFTYAAGQHVVNVTGVLKRRFDPIYESELTQDIERQLFAIDVPNQFFGDGRTYGYTPYDQLNHTMLVNSLPNGLEAAVHVIARFPDGFIRCAQSYEHNITVALVKVVISGGGTLDGSGVVAIAESLTLWRKCAPFAGYDSYEVVGQVPHWDKSTQANVRDSTATTQHAVDDYSYKYTANAFPLGSVVDGSLDTTPSPFHAHSGDVRFTRKFEALVQLVPNNNNSFTELVFREEVEGDTSGGPCIVEGARHYEHTLITVGPNTNTVLIESAWNCSWSVFKLERVAVFSEFSCGAATSRLEREFIHSATVEGSNQGSVSVNWTGPSSQAGYLTIEQMGGQTAEASSCNRIDRLYERQGSRTYELIKTATGGSDMCTYFPNVPNTRGVIDTFVSRGDYGLRDPDNLDNTESPLKGALLVYAPRYGYDNIPDKLLWGGKLVSSKTPFNTLCLDPRHDRLYVAPEPNAAGLFF